jgi:hypothetical protein
MNLSSWGEMFARRPRPPHRQRFLRVLFVHRVTDVIDSCLRELEKGQFTVSSEVALSSADCAENLRCHPYDVVIDLPCAVDPSEAKATVNDGRLDIWKPALAFWQQIRRGRARPTHNYAKSGSCKEPSRVDDFGLSGG